METQNSLQLLVDGTLEALEKPKPLITTGRYSKGLAANSSDMLPSIVLILSAWMLASSF